MTSQNQSRATLGETDHAPAKSLIGRQPILDAEGRVQAYELLFRPPSGSAGAPIDGNQATASVIVNALTEFGLDQLVGPHRAYINFTEDLLQNDAVLVLPKERIVIEVLENVAVTDKLISSLKGLVRQGYELALDDFVYAPEWEPLIEIATTVKLDVLGLDQAQVEQHVAALGDFDVNLLAEKVETAEQHAFLVELGFDLYQGYYYAKPNVVESNQIPENHLAVLRLLAALNNDNTTMDEVEALVSEDVSLSYRLLRYFNSAFFALPKKVDSIRRAVIYFGIDVLRRWVSLLVMANVSGKPQVLMQNALVRARMCEGLARLKQSPESDTYFTVGLFSILDSLLDMPMARVVESLPLSTEVVDALVSGTGDLGAALRCVCAYEECRWAEVEYAGVDQQMIGKIYLESIEWAFDAASGL